uniref:Uncharacterized protein n=1 Tax=Arundo donax TaxID=35708 RepID=A0A0A8ZR68_ARUDO
MDHVTFLFILSRVPHQHQA